MELAARSSHYLYSSKTQPTLRHATHTDNDSIFLDLPAAVPEDQECRSVCASAFPPSLFFAEKDLHPEGIRMRLTDVLTPEEEIHKIRSVDNPVIALLTDFGNEDFFVASLKGVIAGINPSVRLIDITHGVPSFDIASAGFILCASCGYFPLRTIFLVIVDPGVGSGRKILLVQTVRHFFIAPDNGVLSFALEKESLVQVREIRNPDYFLPAMSSTFEGRDKMAPAAAWLSKGIPVEKFGPETASFYREKTVPPAARGKVLTGSIMYIDKFGNVITNIPAEWLEMKMSPSAGRAIAVKLERQAKADPGFTDRIEAVFRKTYDAADKNDLILLKGSLDSLELAVREGSAADRLNACAGDKIALFLEKE